MVTDMPEWSEVVILLMTCVLLGLFVTVFILGISLMRKSLLAKKEGQQKDMVKMKLNTVRAQLNPHFMFNALAGIQNLMNKGDIDNANRYLGKFARLTRNVLETKELISLAAEMSLLDDYLQMEQLRFEFNYHIGAEETLNTENIEIPSMLLQPFAENAVKHGMVNLSKPGNIIIKFSGKGNDLILAVSDNGNGIKTSDKVEGHGMNLMRDRIELFNAINKQAKMMMNIKSGNEGTTVIITLANWL